MQKAEAEVTFAVVVDWAVTARDKASRVVRSVPRVGSFPVSVVVFSGGIYAVCFLRTHMSGSFAGV